MAAAGGEARAAAVMGASAVSSAPSAIATGHGTSSAAAPPSRQSRLGVHFISKVVVRDVAIFQRSNAFDLTGNFGPSHRDESIGTYVF